MYLAPLSNPTLIKELFNKYGVVGVTDVLSQEECEETIHDIENIVKLETGNNLFSINNINTYDLASSCLNRYGSVGKRALFTKTLLKNRTHKNVRKAYSIVYGLDESELVCQHDRVGWMRPTIADDGSLLEKYNTHYNKPGLHLDIDPKGYYDPSYRNAVDNFLSSLNYIDTSEFISENGAKNITMGLQLQGVLNLFDNQEDDGGFQCIPGGHNELKNWYEESKNYFKNPVPNGNYFYNLERKEDRKYSANATRIPCPAGTLIIFDATLPHGTKPNHSNKNRMIQYIRYMPKSSFPKNVYKKRNSIIEKICKEVNFDPLDEEKTVLYL
ncbi:phytanoyl-CoA dioxygenase [Fadolivirus algeromassiliense]|jgi:ectoine hydroxylase-related dioxygenase (phytanoyl-CoA dioxygenase family)|uniref:Phytanoyl-CoA dioxygenase n=1 Tax=Fadolivirus FV1/VV64 TaxID=3070911 RepID=A0A7D3V7X6_9VIRU|nr:phytanoyl-CoA dioxygenase [Fadolivirus algeromassiliense]QKF94656.1 phytanoyl-CoA dioxygenase [Fadolivirus FV1/VV64]